MREKCENNIFHFHGMIMFQFLQERYQVFVDLEIDCNYQII